MLRPSTCYFLLFFSLTVLSLPSARGQSGATGHDGAASGTCPSWSAKFDGIDDPYIMETLRSHSKQGWDAIIEQGEKLGDSLRQQIEDGEQQLEISRQAEIRAQNSISSAHPQASQSKQQAPDCSDAETRDTAPACQVRLRHNEVLALEGMLDLLRCRVPSHPSTPPRPEGTPIATISVTVVPRQNHPSAAKEGDEQAEFAHALSVGMEQNGKKLRIEQGSYITLRFKPEDNVAGFFVETDNKVLQSRPGTFYLPKDVVGILRAVGQGETTITILGSSGSTKHMEDRSVMNMNSTTFTTESDIWSGYVKGGGPFQSVKGTWNEPIVAGIPGTESAVWIGIDGVTDPELIQTGTAQGFSSGFLGIGAGSFFAFAWTEVLPAPPTQIPFNVTPFDVMNATISPLPGVVAQPNVPAPWVMTLTDSTAGWTSSTPVSYVGPLSSAEWIVEDPTICDAFSCGPGTLATFSNVTFDVGDAVMPGNNAAGLPAFNTSERFDMTQNGIRVASPSNPDCDADGFTVAAGPTPPTAPGPFFTTFTLPEGFVGVPYSATLSVSGLAFPFVTNFTAAQNFMPPGLTLAPPSGKITGTPTSAGTFQFDSTVTDKSNQATCDGQMSIKIAPTIPRARCVYSREVHKWICF